MTTRLNPYLSFAGDASAALAFYQDVFGGDLTINHFGDFGTDDHGMGDQVMHGQLETASGLTLMAADMLPGETLRPGNNLAVSLGGDDTEELRGYWQALSDGGTVTVELATQPWGDEFGMCVDRFGTSWLVNIAGGRLTYPIRAAPGRSGCPSVPQVGDAAAGGSPLALEPRHRPLGPAIDHAPCAGGLPALRSSGSRPTYVGSTTSCSASPRGVPAARLRGWRAAYDNVLETGGFRPHLHPRLG